MAGFRSRSRLVPLLAAAAVFALAIQSLQTFVPAPRALPAPGVETATSAAFSAAVGAAASIPQEAYAFGEDEDDGFDVRFLVVLALPLGAATWALFNVWRVAFRQVSRFSTSNMGSEQGVAPGD
mmetsp:Transcript_64989/g.121012  ORF Transcript_64989/g.121012 Transcript_64989/m.121012 type:complete len:124 (-) Transcript_64989:56-427(-)